MYTVLLAPGEQLATTPEKAYPDLLNDFYRGDDARMAIYRLAAPNITYMEVLWYLVYLTRIAHLNPIPSFCSSITRHFVRPEFGTGCWVCLMSRSLRLALPR